MDIDEMAAAILDELMKDAEERGLFAGKDESDIIEIRIAWEATVGDLLEEML